MQQVHAYNFYENSLFGTLAEMCTCKRHAYDESQASIIAKAVGALKIKLVKKTH